MDNDYSISCILGGIYEYSAWINIVVSNRKRQRHVCATPGYKLKLFTLFAKAL
jgi:hypothetical protein